jgi:hypothetical protein
MASVTIKLTVDTYSILKNHENKDMGIFCRLSQVGGEEIGNYMKVDFLNSELNESYIHKNDFIIWEGIPSSPNNIIGFSDVGYPKISIVEIKTESGESDLGSPTLGEWHFGKTVKRQAINGGFETYTIFFLINDTGVGGVDAKMPYRLDPKMTVNMGDI